jgi:hypothetical protein
MEGDRFELVEGWVTEVVRHLGRAVLRREREFDVATLADFPASGLKTSLTHGLAHYPLRNASPPMSFELAMVTALQLESWSISRFLDAQASQFVETFLSEGRTPSRDQPYPVSAWHGVREVSPCGLHSVFFSYGFFLPAAQCHWRNHALGDLLLLEVVALSASEASLMSNSMLDFQKAVEEGRIDLLAVNRLKGGTADDQVGGR